MHERPWKGAVVVISTVGFVADTLRWLRTGRPDEPLPVDDDVEDDGTSRAA